MQAHSQLHRLTSQHQLNYLESKRLGYPCYSMVEHIFLLIPNYSKAYDPTPADFFAALTQLMAQADFSPYQRSFPGKSRPPQARAGVHPVFLNGRLVSGAVFFILLTVLSSPGPRFPDHCVCHCIVAHPKDTGGCFNRPLSYGCPWAEGHLSSGAKIQPVGRSSCRTLLRYS